MQPLKLWCRIFVNQHRVHSLRKGLCRTTNACDAGLVEGALRIDCNGLITAARFHSPLECHDGLDSLRHYNRCHTLFDYIRSIWPGSGECISPAAIFNDLRFKIAVQSDRLCILVAGLVGASGTAFNLRKTNRGPGLNFKELMYGRLKMMTALCLAWAHTYQTMSLGFHPEQLRPEAFRLPKPKKKFTMSPTCRQTTKMTGTESPGWRLLRDGGVKRQIDGTEMAGWGLAAVSPDNCV